MILSPAEYNAKVGLALLCPITSQVKGYPFEVLLPAGSKVNGAILSDQVKSLDWRARKATMICTLPGPVVDEVLSKLSTLLRAV
jgi:mRNA interferase MazF